MTTPALSMSSPYGRLYRRPGTTAVPKDQLDDAVRTGSLVPSVTNVIDVLNKPFLTGWAGKEASLAAMEIAQNEPHRWAQDPEGTRKWVSSASTRVGRKAAALGDQVHAAIENLALGEPVEVDDVAAGYVRAWQSFVADFAPTFLRAEATCFGTIADGRKRLGYAGTVDAIVEIGGRVMVLDYKTGKSIHTEAALQLSALAHAGLIVDEAGQRLEDAMRIDTGAVLHLGPTGYQLLLVEDLTGPFDAFGRLRRAWDFHATNSATRSAMFFTAPVTPSDLLASTAPAAHAPAA